MWQAGVGGATGTVQVPPSMPAFAVARGQCGLQLGSLVRRGLVQDHSDMLRWKSLPKSECCVLEDSACGREHGGSRWGLGDGLFDPGGQVSALVLLGFGEAASVMTDSRQDRGCYQSLFTLSRRPARTGGFSNIWRQFGVSAQAFPATRELAPWIFR